MPNSRSTALLKRVDAAKNAAALAGRQAPAVLVAPTFDADGFFAVLAKKLADVEKAAEAVVRQHFAEHAAPPGVEAWISTGQSFASADDCPFCGQKLEGLALIEAYKGYFNQAYADLKKQVRALAEQAATGLADERVSALTAQAATNTARIEAWKDQLEIAPPLLSSGQLTQAIAGARASATDLAAAKQGQLLDAFGTAAEKAAIIEQLGQIGAAVTDYNEQINSAINMIDGFKKKITGENVTALQAQIRSLEIALARQHSDAIKAVGDYQAAEVERKTRDDEKTQTRAQLDQLMAATLAQYQGQINHLLGTFGAGFKIEAELPGHWRSAHRVRPSFAGQTGSFGESQGRRCAFRLDVERGRQTDARLRLLLGTGHCRSRYAEGSNPRPRRPSVQPRSKPSSADR